MLVNNSLTNEELNELKEHFIEVKEESQACISIIRLSGNKIDSKVTELFNTVESALDLLEDLLFIKEDNKDYFNTLDTIEATGNTELLPKLSPHMDSVGQMLSIKEEINTLGNKSDKLLNGINSHERY